MAKLIDITDMSDAELDALIGLEQQEATVTSVVHVSGPKFKQTITHYSDGTCEIDQVEHATGYRTVTRYSGENPLRWGGR